MWPFNSDEFQRLSAVMPSSTSNTINIQNIPQTAGPSNNDVGQMTHQQMTEAIMDELVAAGAADFLLIRDQQIREWWESVVARRKKEQEAQERLERQRQLRESALSKLSSEEREALGITAQQSTINTKNAMGIEDWSELMNSLDKLEPMPLNDPWMYRYKDTKY